VGGGGEDEEGTRGKAATKNQSVGTWGGGDQIEKCVRWEGCTTTTIVS